MFRRGLFYSYLSIYLRNFLNLSVTETSLFATFPMLVNILFQTFVWGKLSDRLQKRRTLIVFGELAAGIITFFIWVLHLVPPSLRAAGYVVILGLTFLEIFWSMSNLGWTALVSDLYPDKKRAEIQGKFTSLGGVGRVIGVWIGGLAYDGLSRYYPGWGFHQGLLFFIASGVMLVSTIPMFFVPEGGVGLTGAGDKMKQALMGNCKKAANYSKPLILFLISLVFVNFGRNSVAIIISQYLTLPQGFNVSSSTLSYIVNASSISVILTGVSVGVLKRKLSDRSLFLTGIISAITTLTLYSQANHLFFVFVASFLNGFTFVILFASSYSYIARLIPPEKRGRQFALYNATRFLSWGIPATFITGPLIDLMIKFGFPQVYSYRLSFLVAAVTVSLGIFFFFWADRIIKNHPGASDAN